MTKPEDSSFLISHLINIVLTKINRLLGKRNFERVYRQGRSIAGALLYTKYLRNFKNSHRIGIVVSTKVAKSAVFRNKMRRRIRVVLRDWLKSESAASLPKSDFIITITKPVEEYTILKGAILECLRKLV